ncbi:uncharacterized protein LOC125423147 [Ziziphus jujuba]|uniref:Uncharacterized protein LOC125423147 n=1 Tax=Ziziphus jujuba TaxID=326968 RepID=A0ABM3IPG3_ZIZJJ|nr:uncharacterized protein LOC125423147 [Ziziphus jujuba]
MTSRRLWSSMEETYSYHSEVFMLQLRNELQTIMKSSMKILDYCKKMKKIADKMCSSGFSVSEKELVMCLLNGLGPEYETMHVNYTSRPPLPSLQEVKNYLSHYETTLDQNNTVAMFHSANLVSAFNSQLSLGSNNAFPSSSPTINSINYTSSYSNISNNREYGPGKSDFYARRGFDDFRGRSYCRRNRGSGRSNRKWKPQCQIYGTVGHLASVCYYRDSNSGNSVFQGIHGHTSTPNSLGFNAQFSQLSNLALLNSSIFSGSPQIPLNGVHTDFVSRPVVPTSHFGHFGGSMPMNAAGFNPLVPYQQVNHGGLHSGNGLLVTSQTCHNLDAKLVGGGYSGQASANVATTPVLMGDPN